MSDRELFQRGLDALEYYRSGEDYSPTPASECIAAFRARLAQPDAEPDKRVTKEMWRTLAETNLMLYETEKEHNKIREMHGLNVPEGMVLVPQSALRVIEAAKWVNWCPDAGGYKDGRSVEDCYEELAAACREHFAIDIEVPVLEWISEDDLLAAAQEGK